MLCYSYDCKISPSKRTISTYFGARTIWMETLLDLSEVKFYFSGRAKPSLQIHDPEPARFFFRNSIFAPVRGPGDTLSIFWARNLHLQQRHQGFSRSKNGENDKNWIHPKIRYLYHSLCGILLLSANQQRPFLWPQNRTNHSIERLSILPVLNSVKRVLSFHIFLIWSSSLLILVDFEIYFKIHGPLRPIINIESIH